MKRKDPPAPAVPTNLLDFDARQLATRTMHSSREDPLFGGAAAAAKPPSPAKLPSPTKLLPSPTKLLPSPTKFASPTRLVISPLNFNFNFSPGPFFNASPTTTEILNRMVAEQSTPPSENKRAAPPIGLVPMAMPSPPASLPIVVPPPPASLPVVVPPPPAPTRANPPLVLPLLPIVEYADMSNMLQPVPDRDLFVATYKRDRLLYTGVEHFPRGLFTSPGTLAPSPNLLSYSLPRADAMRVMATHFATPGRFIATGAAFIASMDYDNKAWRTKAAKLVDHSLMLLPCQRPAGDYDRDWFCANVLGSFVLVTCYDAPPQGLEDLVVVGVGVVTGEPLANTLDPELRLRGGCVDSFDACADANPLLVPIHMISCTLSGAMTMRDVLNTEINSELLHVDMSSNVAHTCLPASLEYLAVDVRRFLVAQSPPEPSKEYYMANVLRILLLEASKSCDSMDLTKQAAAAAAIDGIVTPNTAAAPLCAAINRSFTTKLKDPKKVVKLFAANLKKMNLYADYDELAAAHELTA